MSFWDKQDSEVIIMLLVDPEDNPDNPIGKAEIGETETNWLKWYETYLDEEYGQSV